MGLTTGQQNGLFKINHSNSHIVIMGPAGTGKTYLLRSFLDTVNINVCAFAAPTHAAKQVLQDTINSGRPEEEKITAHTIHALLKIHPETYEDQVVFDPNGEMPDLSNLKFLVVDEVSMVDGLLFGRIMSAAKQYNLRIIGLGDPYQLQPVKPDGCMYNKQLGDVSPMLFHPEFERVILDEIVRQSKDNPIIEVATKIRKENFNIYDCRGECNEVGVFKHKTPATMMQKYMKLVKTPEDTLKYKFLAYLNKDVNSINDFVRRKLFDTEEPVVEGEYIVMQEPVYTEFAGQEMLVYHNGQVCKVLSIDTGTEQTETIKLPNMFFQGYIEGEVDEFGMDKYGTIEVDPIEIRFWRLNLVSMDDDPVEHTIDVIKDEESINTYNEYLETAAGIYKDKGRIVEGDNSLLPHQKKLKKKLLWRKYWELKKRFVDTKGSAACTIHKSQGATFDGVFILTNKLNTVDFHLSRQLKYVAVTRARKFADFV